MLARSTGPPWIFPTTLPHNSTSWWEDLAEILHFEVLNISLAEFTYFAERVYILMTSCEARWDNQYDNFTYWDFMHASELSEQYRKYLVIGVTRGTNNVMHVPTHYVQILWLQRLKCHP